MLKLVSQLKKLGHWIPVLISIQCLHRFSCHLFLFPLYPFLVDSVSLPLIVFQRRQELVERLGFLRTDCNSQHCFLNLVTCCKASVSVFQTQWRKSVCTDSATREALFLKQNVQSPRSLSPTVCLCSHVCASQMDKIKCCWVLEAQGHWFYLGISGVVPTSKFLGWMVHVMLKNASQMYFAKARKFGIGMFAHHIALVAYQHRVFWPKMINCACF